MIQLTDATITVNDSPVAVMPDSVTFTEGLGEQTMRAASTGGGNVEVIYSNDLSTGFATIKFDMPSVIEYIEEVKNWKQAGNSNTVSISGEAGSDSITRTFSKAALTMDYEVALGPDGVISVEFKALPST
jgi:hypothetical protein|tara:strand:+ start:606 stop:995 length:390 start_codon:yes stop_codon:yes gene_type:complete